MNEILADAEVFGLIADITGAIFISKSVFYRNNSEIFNNSAGFMGFNYKGSLDAIIAKREALFGTSMLILGFIGQLIGSQESSSHSTILPMIIFIFFVVLVSILALKIIAKWSKKTADKLVTQYNKEKRP